MSETSTPIGKIDPEALKPYAIYETVAKGRPYRRKVAALIFKKDGDKREFFFHRLPGERLSRFMRFTDPRRILNSPGRGLEVRRTPPIFRLGPDQWSKLSPETTGRL